MTNLTDTQLMILDNLIYLRPIANGNKEFRDVANFIEHITNEDGSTVNFSKIAEAEQQAKIDTLTAAGQYDAAESIRNMSSSEFSNEYITDDVIRSYQKTVDMVKSQGSALMNLEIVYTSGDYKEQLMANGADQYCTDGLTAVCFKDTDGNATVIYRGTDGYTAWSENAQAACMSDTPYQQLALDFFESIPGLQDFNDVQLSGHSKGGNLAQYVTILSGEIDYCLVLE